MKNLIKIIKEEVSGFDFLGNEERIKEAKTIETLNNLDLQKQFIYDSILGKDNIKQINVVDAKISSDLDSGSDATKLSIEYYLELSYQYDPNNDPLQFSLNFNGYNIHIDTDSVYDDETNSGESWFSYFDWLDIQVDLYTLDGEEIKFIEFEKAPTKIKNLFIREYTKPFIESETGFDFRTQQDK